MRREDHEDTKNTKKQGSASVDSPHPCCALAFSSFIPLPLVVLSAFVVLLILFAPLWVGVNLGQGSESGDQTPIEAFQEKRFGMFIHWGPVSIRGTEIGWSRGREVPNDEYDELYTQFNPVEFDAEEWVRLADQAGMKYLVITSRHHDGFSLWDTKFSDYKITRAPFGRDVMRELSDACRKQGIEFSVYYSLCDWYHPDYPLGSPGGKTEKPRSNMPRYYEFVKNQTREILESYGPLGVFWFDGEWEAPWTREYGNELYAYLKGIQPDLVINNRVSKGRQGMAGTTVDADENAGDFDTPEQRIGTFNRERPWETCMTLGKQWAWKPGEELKSSREALQTLLRVAGGDGNLLLNVGPRPDGRIDPGQADVLREMGTWMSQYGDCVYGTRGGPFKPGKWGASTCKEDRIYLFVMGWPVSGKLRLPRLPVEVQSSKSLSGTEFTLREDSTGYYLSRRDAQSREAVTVVELKVPGSAFDISPVEVEEAED